MNSTNQDNQGMSLKDLAASRKRRRTRTFYSTSFKRGIIEQLLSGKTEKQLKKANNIKGDLIKKWKKAFLASPLTVHSTQDNSIGYSNLQTTLKSKIVKLVLHEMGLDSLIDDNQIQILDKRGSLGNVHPLRRATDQPKANNQ